MCAAMINDKQSERLKQGHALAILCVKQVFFFSQKQLFVIFYSIHVLYALQCPVDEAIQNGEPCDGGEGICYHGHCPTRTKQCQLLWGDNAESSKDTCYNTNNLLGSVYGHCGQTTDGYYQRCSPQ